jgi:hypothetical protein
MEVSFMRRIFDLCDENAFCEICGQRGALQLDGHVICESCYSDYGSCCLEFAGNDLTADTGIRAA